MELKVKWLVYGKQCKESCEWLHTLEALEPAGERESLERLGLLHEGGVALDLCDWTD